MLLDLLAKGRQDLGAGRRVDPGRGLVESQLGAIARASAMASFIFVPPDSVPTRCLGSTESIGKRWYSGDPRGIERTHKAPDAGAGHPVVEMLLLAT